MNGNILAAIEPNWDAERTISCAAARSIELRARLAVVCVWSRPRLSTLAVLGWADLAELDREVARDAEERVRTVVSALPRKLTVESVCRQGPLGRQVSLELGARHYDELVVARGRLPRRLTDKLARLYPQLRIVIVGRDRVSGWSPEQVGDGSFRPFPRSRPEETPNVRLNSKTDVGSRGGPIIAAEGDVGVYTEFVLQERQQTNAPTHDPGSAASPKSQ